MICRTKKEVETAIVRGLAELLKDQMAESGVITAEAAPDTIIVRVKGIMSPAEKVLIRNQEGRELLKEIKQRVMERSKPLLEKMIREAISMEIVDIHSSFDPVKDERIVVFTLGAGMDFKTGEEYNNRNTGE